MAAKRFSGDFVMTQGGRSYKVTWHGGAIVGADSPSPADSLGRIALTAGLVNSTQLGDALRLTTTQPARSQLEILARVAQLSAQQVLTIKRRALAHRAVRVFALEDATFVLDDVPTLQPDPELPPLSARWVIYQGVRTHYGEERLATELTSSLQASFRLAPSSRPVLRDYGFGADGKVCVTELSKRSMTIDELAAAFPRVTRKSIMALVYVLVASDALVVDSGGAARSPGHPGRPAGVAARPPAATPATLGEPASPPGAPVAHHAPAQAPPRAPRDTVPDAIPGARPRRPSGPVPAAVTDEGGSRKVTILGRRTGKRRAVNPERVAQIEEFIQTKLEEIEHGANHFQILGVVPEASDRVIRSAYFALAKKLHPDILRSYGVKDESRAGHRLLAHVNEIYALLSNPRSRAEYQASLLAAGTGTTRKEQEKAGEFALRAIEAEKHFQRGEMAARRDQWREALTEFEKAVELNPQDAEHHALLAWATWCTASDKDAVLTKVKKIFKRAIALSPRSVAAYFYRGRVASDIGDYDLALDCFNKVLSVEPQYGEATLQIRLIESRLERGGDRKKGLFDRLKRR